MGLFCEPYALLFVQPMPSVSKYFGFPAARERGRTGDNVDQSSFSKSAAPAAPSQRTDRFTPADTGNKFSPDKRFGALDPPDDFP